MDGNKITEWFDELGLEYKRNTALAMIDKLLEVKLIQFGEVDGEDCLYWTDTKLPIID